jgi:hypothetical protein
MAEGGKSVVDSLNGKILYINVMNRLSGAMKIVLGVKHFVLYLAFTIVFALLSGFVVDFI